MPLSTSSASSSPPKDSCPLSGEARRRADAYLQGGYGALIGFELAGGLEAGRAFIDALHAPETKARFASLMAEPVGSSPAEFDKFMASERAKYQAIVKASGAKVD